MDPAAPRRRTQLERRSESEESLLEAAAQLVAERGLDRASLASIGQRAGASRGLPTHHFGSKDALVARLAWRAQEQIEIEGRAAVERGGHVVEEVPGLVRVRTAVDNYLERFEHPSASDRALIVMWGATFPAEASVQGMLDADQRSLDGWTSLILAGQDDGSISTNVDPTTTAVLLQSLIRGVAATLLIDARRTETGRLRNACQIWLTSVLAPSRDDVELPAESAQ